MNFKFTIAIISILAVVACSQKEYLGVDYHVHITSPEMAQEMNKLCGTILVCQKGIVPYSSAMDIEKSLKNTVFNRAVVLSGAYFAGMPEMELDIETQKKLTRSENEFVARQVSSSKKLFGFF